MKDAITISTTCEMLYKLRDAVAAHDLAYAVLLSREVHDKLLQMVVDKETLECKLNCEVKDETK